MLKESSIYSHLNIVFRHVLSEYLDDDDTKALLSASTIEDFDMATLIGIQLDYEYSLKYASKYGHFRVVQYLVEKGADIHTQDNYSLRISSTNGYLSIVQYLVENGADIHANYNESLLAASEDGHLPVVQYLVENGASIYKDNCKAATSKVNTTYLKILFSKIVSFNSNMSH